MAQATTYKFSEFLVMLSDGASPEVFADPCGLTSRGWTRTKNMNETVVPDCDDPDAPADIQRDTISKGWTISGAGVVANESFDSWNDWYESDETRNVRIELGSRVWVGPAKCSELVVQGERGQRVNLTISIVSDGAITQISS